MILRFINWLKNLFRSSKDQIQKDEVYPFTISESFRSRKTLQRRHTLKSHSHKRKFNGAVGYGASHIEKKALKAYLKGNLPFEFNGRVFPSWERWIKIKL